VAADGKIKEFEDVGEGSEKSYLFFNSLPILETAQPKVGFSDWNSTACRMVSSAPPTVLENPRTKCLSCPVILITASRLQGEQPLVDGTM